MICFKEISKSRYEWLLNKRLDSVNYKNMNKCNKCYPTALQDNIGNIYAFLEHEYLGDSIYFRYFERSSYV